MKTKTIIAALLLCLPMLTSAQVGDRARQTKPKTSDSRSGASKQGASKVGKKAIIQRLMDNMVAVDGGTFTMGDSDGGSYTKPHQVTLSSFSIAKYEVTQEEWQAVMGYNPSFTKAKNHPVGFVSWLDCQEFISKLNSLTGKQFRLPTEAEWEFAARGGNNSKGYKYAGGNNFEEVGWYADNSEHKAHEVGQKAPNELGLYDMSGNVWEWCQDWHGYYGSEPQTDPVGRENGSERVFRGGGWNCSAKSVTTFYRGNGMASQRLVHLGLRLAQ